MEDKIIEILKSVYFLGQADFEIGKEAASDGYFEAIAEAIEKIIKEDAN